MISACEAGMASAGDGICPLEWEFDATAAIACEQWRSTIAGARAESLKPDIFGQLTELLRHVPPFRAVPSVGFESLEGPFLQVKCRSECLTTDDASCEAPRKATDHYQIIGLSSPMPYDHTDESETRVWQEMTESGPGLSSQFFLAWTYILSSRWVETLQQTGGSARLLQRENLTAQSFWRVILSHAWQTCYTRKDGTWYAPWALRSNCSEAIAVEELSEASASAASALAILETFLTSDELVQQSLMALVAVLVMIDPLHAISIKLPKPGPSLESSDSNGTTPVKFPSGMQSLLDRCITLSCSPEGVRSLLSAVFFDPSVPCNLVGAQMTGVMEALSELGDDRQALLSALSCKCPKIAVLWPAAIFSGQLDRILRTATNGSPPLNMMVAIWTGTLQCFIQASYSIIDIEPGQLSRASEFALTWFILPNANVPFVASPPFGTVPEKNLSLEIRSHVRHHHRLMEYKMYWLLEPEGQSDGLDHRFNISSPAIQLAAQPSAAGGKQYHQIDSTSGASETATLNLFQWHRWLDGGGLWLADGPEGQKLLHHEWISVLSSDEEDNDDGDDSSDRRAADGAPEKAFDTGKIERWLES